MDSFLREVISELLASLITIIENNFNVNLSIQQDFSGDFLLPHHYRLSSWRQSEHYFTSLCDWDRSVYSNGNMTVDTQSSYNSRIRTNSLNSDDSGYDSNDSGPPPIVASALSGPTSSKNSCL